MSTSPLGGHESAPPLLEGGRPQLPKAWLLARNIPSQVRPCVFKSLPAHSKSSLAQDGFTEAAHLQDRPPNGTNPFAFLKAFFLYKAIADVRNPPRGMLGTSGRWGGFLSMAVGPRHCNSLDWVLWDRPFPGRGPTRDSLSRSLETCLDTCTTAKESGDLPFSSQKAEEKILSIPHHLAFRKQYPALVSLSPVAPLVPAQTYHSPSSQQWPRVQGRTSVTSRVRPRGPPQHHGASRNPHSCQDRAGAHKALPSVKVSNELFIHYV